MSKDVQHAASEPITGGVAPVHTDISTIAGSPNADSERHGHMARAVRATSLMTLASRVGGLVRDVIIGRIFGDATLVGSAFNAAFAIPNMFRRLFGEGALSAAFVPAYTEARRQSSSHADGFASLTFLWLGIATTLLTIVIEAALLLVLIFAPHDPERALSLKLIMVMLPFMPLICGVAILAGMLQVHARYGPAASGPLVLNAFIVGVGVWCILTGNLGDERIAYALGVATVLSGATQLWWFLRLLRPHARWVRSWGDARPRARAMLRAFIPVAVGLGTLQLNAFLDTLLAMWPIWVGPTILGYAYPLDEASNFILGQTQRFYQFPLGVFGIAIATAVFPLLSRFNHQPHHFADTLRRGIRLSLFIGLPASLGLILVRHDAIGVLYGHGKSGWSAANLDRSAAVLAGFAIAVWAYSLNHLFSRAFYARKDTTTPMRVSLCMVALNFSLNICLIWYLRSESGLAWSTSICAIVQTVILGVLLAERLQSEGQRLLDSEIAQATTRHVLACAVMAVAVIVTQRFLPPPGTWSLQCVRVVTTGAIGVLAFLGTARALKCPEIGWLLRRAS